MAGKRTILSSPLGSVESESKRKLPDRLLSLFAEVRGGEGIGALLLAANV
jgi:hypothetical protein